MTTDIATRPGSGDVVPGRTELGTITISTRVVEKVAARAAAEVPDAGAAAPRVLGRSVSRARVLGARQTSLTGLPKASADVDGSRAMLDLSISVRWPASVPSVARAVREHVTSRVNELTGLIVTEVAISVTDLVTQLPAPPRVH
ncbi:MAG TPA: Asp23/Gls24 family envelope stress response protein [Streptosporangiaceae bacterium]|jgi:uncharacterized alkaline shock family protein YloU